MLVSQWSSSAVIFEMKLNCDFLSDLYGADFDLPTLAIFGSRPPGIALSTPRSRPLSRRRPFRFSEPLSTLSKPLKLLSA